MKTRQFPTSSCRQTNHGDGFTLVDLLAILAVVALLALMLLPAHAGDKWRMRQMVCASNVKQLTMALHVYGGDNNNKLPVTQYFGSTVWPWDLPPSTADAMLSYGLHKRDFYCPSTAPFFTDWDNFLSPNRGYSLWNFTSNFRVTGYGFALSGPGSGITSSNQNTTLLPERLKISAGTFLPAPPNSERELVADAIISSFGQNNPAQRLTGNYNYSSIVGGFYKPHTSAHLNGPLPEGSNIGFKDGHVAWRKFSDPLVSARTSYPYFWW